MKTTIRIFLTYSIIFFLIINLDFIDIFVYNGIFSMILSFLITLVIFYKKNYKNLLAILIVSISIHFSLFLFIPVTIDRSISVNLLTEIEKNYKNEYLNKEEISKIIREYTTTNEFVEKRIEEQIASKNIKQTSEGYILTDSGQMLIKIFQLLTKIYDF
jgi:energy-coupling factor transporter transmembrane protein EcfT